MHLWEANHPYYCNDTNYLANGSLGHGQHRYESWADFHEEWSLEHTDMDYNLVFRWDWKKADPDDWDLAGEYGVPEELPGDTLHLYYMMQRKGFFQVCLVQLTEDDEPAVREFLSAYADHMRKIWEPLLS